MIQIDFGPSGRTCDGLVRRDFLRASLYGLAGMGLSSLVRVPVFGAEQQRYVRDKAVVLLFLSGGPSQYETFDPKPDGIGSFTSIAGHIATRLPGVRFASYFPQLAERADRLTVVRSLVARTANHDQAVKNLLTGGLNAPQAREGAPIARSSMGSVYARACGANHPKTGMPTYAFLPPKFPKVAGLKISSVNPGVETAQGGSEAGPLGPVFRPFNPEASNSWKELITSQIPEIQLDGRRNLLRQLEQSNRVLDGQTAAGQFGQVAEKAFDLLRSGAVHKALDLSLEHPKVLAAYDTSRYPIYGWSDKNRWIKDGPSTGFPLGRQMLLARRLIEAGSRFVTVVHSNWDMHGGHAIWGIKDGMEVFGPPLDHAVAAFLDDLQQRGLGDKILLVITGEFGRTGRINKDGGRDHNKNVSPVVFAGGALRHGQVIGSSNARGERADKDVVTVDDLAATLMHYLLDVEKVRLDRETSPHLQELVIDHGQPIRGLF